MSDKAHSLIIKYLIREASSSDLTELDLWCKDANNEREFINYIKTNYLIDYNLKKFNSNLTTKKLQQLIENEKKLIQLRRAKKLMKYAAVFICLFASAYFMKDYFFGLFTNDAEITPIIVNSNTIEPGIDKATLTLGDGSKVVLEKGESFQTQNASSNGKELIYDEFYNGNKEITNNYLTIPRGGQFFVKLPDGTQVWLNSESQLKYPVAFINGIDRKVELVYGEAYFDVSPSNNHAGSKFKVINNYQEVEVLGTEFNIKAYRDENHIYTTLVEGKVSIVSSTTNANKMLKPSEQANFNFKENSMSVSKVDVYNEISWKEGVFSFKGKTLKEIMKVISRWYDADVVFENKDIESLKFNGVLNKKQSIEEIMSIMKSTTINNYEIEDKTITLK